MAAFVATDLWKIFLVACCTYVTSVGGQNAEEQCLSFETSDFRFSDITKEGANISYFIPSTDLVSNSSAIVYYSISYRGKYRGLVDVDGMRNRTADEDMWFPLDGLHPWPTQYIVCLQITYMDNGTLITVDGEEGCAILCTKMDYFDFFAITAMGCGGLILLCLLCSMGCAAKWEDPYKMSQDEIFELSKIKRIQVKENRKNRVGIDNPI